MSFPLDKTPPPEGSSTPLIDTSKLAQTVPGQAPTPTQQADTRRPELAMVLASTIGPSDAQKTDWSTDSGTPELPPPLSVPGQTAITQQAVAVIVTGFIIRELETLLAPVGSVDDQKDLSNHLIQGTPLKNPKLGGKAAEIKSQVESKIQKEGLKNFSLSALHAPNETAWIQSAPSSDAIGILSPLNVSLARTGLVMKNLDQAVDNVTTASNKLLDSLPKNDPRRELLKNFIAAIIEATFGFKQSLAEFQVLLAQQSEGKIQSIGDLIKLRDKLLPRRMKEADDAAKKQAKAESMGKLMKILGPIVSALVTAITAVVAFVTGGLGSPLLIAALAVGTIMTAYSVVDSTVEVTSKMIEGLNKLAEKATQDGSDLDKALFKFALALGAVAVAVVVTASIASGQPGATAGLATQTAGVVMKEVALQVTKQLVIQATIIFIMSSGVMLELPTELLKLTGADETTVDALRFTFLALEMILMMAVLHKVTKPPTPVPTTAVTETTQTVTQQAAATARNIAAAAKEAILKSTDEVLTMFGDALAGTLKALDPRTWGALAKSMGKGIFDSIILPVARSFGGFVGDVDAATLAKIKFDARLQVANTFGRLSQPVMNIVTTSVMASVHFTLADIYRDQGETEKEQEQLNLLIDLVDNFLKQLNASQNSTADLMELLSESIDNNLKVLTKIGDKFAETVRASSQA